MHYMLLITIIFMDMLGGAEVDLFVPSFPEISKVFNLSAFWLEALLSVNFAGYVLSLLFCGGLADRYGRKPIILLGLAIFIFGSMLCVWGTIYQVLLVGRFLQGLGVAAPATLCYLIIADSYSLKAQQSLMALLNGVMNIAVAVAPVAGSYITMHFHYQGNFMVLLMLAVVTCLMTVIFIPAAKPPEHKEPISLSGYVPIFKSKLLMLLLVNMIFMCVPYWVFVGMSPMLFMQDLGVSLTHYGYYQGVWALVYALASILSGVIINKYDQKKMLYLSSIVSTIALLVILLITCLDCRSPLLITLAFLPFNLGMILPSTILYPLCLNFMPQAKGRVSGLLQGAKLILTALGLELAGYYYVGSFRNIGLVISFFVLGYVLTLFWVIKSTVLMQALQETIEPGS